MNFIINKNMPDDIKYALNKIGNIFEGTELNLKDSSVGLHPDIQIHFVDGKTAYCEPTLYEYYKKILPAYVTLKRGSSYVGFTYPDNCAYNIARMGKNIICNINISDTNILDFYKENGYNIINVNQGYAKCNVCPLSDNFIITEDIGIYRAVKNSIELNVAYMPVGRVMLDGFDYGFIGGASGLADKTLLLCGKAPKELLDILNMNKIEYIELSEKVLYDYGSILSFD